MSRRPGDWRPGAPIVLQTERFTLRSSTRFEAWRATYPWTFDPEVMHPLGHPAGTWTRYTWYRQSKRYDNRRRFFLAIYPKSSNATIGFETIHVTSGVALLSVAIGNREWWGRGVVQETRRAVIEFLFEQVGCHRVWGAPTARNFASVFNYQALGFAHEGVLRGHTFDHSTQEYVDSLVFGLLRNEWRARRMTEPASSQPLSAFHDAPAGKEAGLIRAAIKPEDR